MQKQNQMKAAHSSQAERHEEWLIEKLEKMRRTALLLIRNVDALEEADALVFMQLRRLQKEIARFKIEHALRERSETAWVDEWHQ